MIEHEDEFESWPTSGDPDRISMAFASVMSAIIEGPARVERARQADAQAQAREIAKELLVRADAIATHAAELDAANAARIEAARAISEELQTMRQIAHGLGVFVPSEQQFLSLGERAERTTLMEMPFHRIAERLGPTERRTHKRRRSHASRTDP